MATPNRNYSEIPGSVAPDVPFYANRTFREIDVDIAGQMGRIDTHERAVATHGLRLGQLDGTVGSQSTLLGQHGERLSAVEVLGGLAPGDVDDATVAGLLANPATTSAQSIAATIRGGSVVPVAKVVPGSVSINSAVAAAVAAGGGDVVVPAGSYTLPASLELPRTVRLVGAGSGVTKLYAPQAAQKTITITGGGAGWGPVPIQGLSLDGISLVFGSTTADTGNGMGIRDVEVYNCTTLPGVVIRHNAWSLRFQNCRIYNCTVGVKHDFVGVGVGSGANISYTDCMIFNCTDAGWWQNGAALDGWHASFVNCNVEHNGTSFRLTGVGDGVLDLSNQHVEGNQSSYLEADSGTVVINSIWAFEFLSSSTTKTAFFVLSGTAKVSVLSGRLGWAAGASPLAKITGTTARLSIHPAVNTHPMGVKPASSGMPGGQLAAGADTGAHIPAGTTTGMDLAGTVALTGAGASAVIFNAPAGDGGTYRLRWAAQVTAAGTNAAVRVTLNPGTGGANLDLLTVPAVLGWVYFEAYLSPTAFHVDWRHSNGTAGTATAATSHAGSVNRFVAMSVLSAGTNMTATRFLAESLGRP